MTTQSEPDSEYTRTWSPSGVIEYATLADGSRLRYLKVGAGRTPLLLVHTVRTQLDHFQFVIPELLAAFTVYAIDLPGMGWSDISPAATYTESAFRSAIVEFVTALELEDAILAGESMGATLSLTASVDLQDRVSDVVAINPFDYPKGVGRANLVASVYVGAARLPAIGSLVTGMENKPVLGMVLRGGLRDGNKLPDRYLAELRRVGRRSGILAGGARGLPQRGQHDRRASTLRSRQGTRDTGLRRPRLGALARTRGERSTDPIRPVGLAPRDRSFRLAGAARARRRDPARQHGAEASRRRAETHGSSGLARDLETEPS